MSDVFEINGNIKVDEPKEKVKREKVKIKKPISEERKSVLIKQLKDARERKRLLREGNKEPVKEVVKEPVKVVVKEPMVKDIQQTTQPIKQTPQPIKQTPQPVKQTPQPVKSIPKPVMPNNIENVKSNEFDRNVISNPIEIPKALPTPVLSYNLFTNNKKTGFWVN